MLQLSHGRVIAVVAVGMHHAERRRETSAPGAVESGEGAGRISQERRLASSGDRYPPTACPSPNNPVAGRRSKVLAENHRIVAPLLGVEHGVAVVRIGKPARDVELPLHPA